MIVLVNGLGVAACALCFATFIQLDAEPLLVFGSVVAGLAFVFMGAMAWRGR